MALMSDGFVDGILEPLVPYIYGSCYSTPKEKDNTTDIAKKALEPRTESKGMLFCKKCKKLTAKEKIVTLIIDNMKSHFCSLVCCCEEIHPKRTIVSSHL